jgi:hypothetical protein
VDLPPKEAVLVYVVYASMMLTGNNTNSSENFPGDMASHMQVERMTTTALQTIRVISLLLNTVMRICRLPTTVLRLNAVIVTFHVSLLGKGYGEAGVDRGWIMLREIYM